jgi:hypothetical protein
MNELPFSIGILSWNGYDSLLNSLLTYEKNGLSKLTKYKYICLPEYKQEGIQLAKKFSYKPILFKKNLGILGGFKALAEKMPSGPILLLENDLPLIEDQNVTFDQIQNSIKLLSNDNVIQVRLRSRTNPGLPFVGIEKYQRYWSNNIISYIKRILRPSKAKRLIGTATYVIQNPVKRHPNYIKSLSHSYFSVSSSVLNWANLAILVDRDKFLNIIIPKAETVSSNKKINGFKNIEIELNSFWWRKQNFEIIVAPGLFTHFRVSDRGY